MSNSFDRYDYDKSAPRADEDLPDRNRRVINTAAENVAKALSARKERMTAPPDKPRPKPLTEVAQVERQIYLANLALNKYEVMLEDGEELDVTMEARFLQHQDSLRKLATTLASLKAKADLGKDSEVELAKKMVDSGIPKEEVLELYPQNPKVAAALKELP